MISIFVSVCSASTEVKKDTLPWMLVYAVDNVKVSIHSVISDDINCVRTFNISKTVSRQAIALQD